MATAEELLARTADMTIEPHIIVSPNRVITVPTELRTIVQYDRNIETVIFDCPRYWDEHDMSKMKVTIEYTRADKVTGQYICSNVWVNPDDDTIMHFSWTIDDHVSAVVGQLSIQVVVKDADKNGDLEERWGSITNNEMRVEPSLNASAGIATAQPDAILNIVSRLENLETHIPQSDWNAKIGESGHIENRTHYVENTRGDAILETMNIEFMPMSSRDSTIGYARYTTDEFRLDSGKYYMVMFDNKEYVCVCKTRSDGSRYLGNAALVSRDILATSEDFCISAGTSSTTTVLNIWHKNPNITAHVVGIYECVEIVHKLDNKFISAVKSINGVEPDEYGNVDITAQSGSFGEEVEELILTLFRNVAYTADMSETYSRLEALLLGPYSVRYFLVGVTVSNTATSVSRGDTYTTTLLTNPGYTLDGVMVTVTMNNTPLNISKVYRNGVITIANVTGPIVISVTAKEAEVSPTTEE